MLFQFLILFAVNATFCVKQVQYNKYLAITVPTDGLML